MNKKKIASLGLLATLLSGLANEVRTQVSLNTSKIIKLETINLGIEEKIEMNDKNIDDKLHIIQNDLSIIKRHLLKGNR